MKMKQYLDVAIIKPDGSYSHSTPLKLSEVHLINKILKEVARPQGKIIVSLEETTDLHYKSIFSN